MRECEERERVEKRQVRAVGIRRRDRENKNKRL